MNRLEQYNEQKRHEALWIIQQTIAMEIAPRLEAMREPDPGRPKGEKGKASNEFYSIVGFDRAWSSE